MKRTLKNLIPLEHNVKIYVPFTMNVNQQTDNSKFVDNTLNFLSIAFNGSTSYEAIGCWHSQELGLIKEKIVVCESYCKENELKKEIDPILSYCEGLKNQLQQEAISLEIDNKLYFV
jgi:hypothetical protein